VPVRNGFDISLAGSAAEEGRQLLAGGIDLLDFFLRLAFEAGIVRKPDRVPDFYQKLLCRLHLLQRFGRLKLQDF
jgi:hypothetical protein